MKHQQTPVMWVALLLAVAFGSAIAFQTAQQTALWLIPFHLGGCVLALVVASGWQGTLRATREGLGIESSGLPERESQFERWAKEEWPQTLAELSKAIDAPSDLLVAKRVVIVDDEHRVRGVLDSGGLHLADESGFPLATLAIDEGGPFLLLSDGKTIRANLGLYKPDQARLDLRPAESAASIGLVASSANNGCLLTDGSGGIRAAIGFTPEVDRVTFGLVDAKQNVVAQGEA